MTEKAYAKLVARNLRNIAVQNDKTQADIARDLNLSKATVSSWMNGTRIPRMDKIDLLCHYFNCKRSDIMEDQEEVKAEPYYFNDDARELAEFLFHNPEYKVLFDASRKVKKEDIEFVKQMIDRMN